MTGMMLWRRTLGKNEVVLLDETIEGVLCEIVNVAGSSQGCKSSETEGILHCGCVVSILLIEVGCSKERCCRKMVAAKDSEVLR